MAEPKERTLLPDRHPNRDFFVLDIKDSSPRDDLASMEHPFYSLSVKPDLRELEYENNGRRLRVIPSGIGLPTIMDKDIILYAISKLTHQKNAGIEIDQWVEMSAHEVMVAVNWNTARQDYKRLENALVRLRSTTFVSDIETGGELQTKGFGIIEEFEVERRNEKGKIGPFGRMSKIRIKLSSWTFNAVKAGEVLAINPLYFRLRRPLERRIYELARKHCGDQESWRIGFDRFQKKVGSNAPAKKFRYFIKEIIADGHIPDYMLSLDGQNVVVHPVRQHVPIGNLRLKVETMERAKALAVEKGYDVYALEQEFIDFAQRKGRPDNPDGAFIGFIKKKKPLRGQGSLL
ncbi:MAG: replication initiator protein A [Pseudomonadota bacterium]